MRVRAGPGDTPPELTTSNCDLLLLAAFPPELAALQGRLGPAMRGAIAGLDVAARPVGIGLAAAAAGAARRLEELHPRAVVLLGTCGAYPLGDAAVGAAAQGLAVGHVAVARAVILVAPAVVEQRAAFPDPMSLEARADAALATALAQHPGACLCDVATTLAVTTDDALARSLGLASRCAAEHLEAYAVATACAASGVSFAAALGVANDVGSKGRAQWREHHHAAGAAAIAAAVAWIERGAVGLAAITR